MAVTINEGTQTAIKTTDDSGNIQHVRADGGTVGIVSNLTNGSVNILTGTVTSVGTVVGVGTLTNVGSLTNVGNLPQISVGTVPQVSIGTIPQVSVGTLPSDGTIVRLTSAGTFQGFNTGTVTSGSLTDLAKLYGGTIQVGTFVQPTGTVTTVVAGTQNTLGTVGVVNNIVTGTLASVRVNPTPVGSAVLSTHVLGTGGGTQVGTLVAPTGAGTFLYLAGLQIVGNSGTATYTIANNVAGSTGAGVYAKGLFDPSGGVARDFNPAINLGTNGTLAYNIVGAGTAHLVVNYWVSP